MIVGFFIALAYRASLTFSFFVGLNSASFAVPLQEVDAKNIVDTGFPLLPARYRRVGAAIRCQQGVSQRYFLMIGCFILPFELITRPV